jgi:hypothetical protein
MGGAYPTTCKAEDSAVPPQIPWCNVPHNPDIRNATYEPVFPPICHLPLPFPLVTSTAAFSAIVITAATISVTSAVFTIDNLNTTQILEYTKDRYNVKIRNERVSPKVPPTTYVG